MNKCINNKKERKEGKRERKKERNCLSKATKASRCQSFRNIWSIHKPRIQGGTGGKWNGLERGFI
jgi:hypothetical protein